MKRLLPFAALLAAAAAPPGDAPVPIPGAGGWGLVERLPGVPQPVCHARINGPEADTMLLLNRDRQPILAAGRADWHELLGEADVTLSIDGDPPIRLKMEMFNNLVMKLVDDKALLDRLRRARTLDWTFPFGRYRADVAGIGTALDALAACARRHAAEAPVA
ncbi:MAG TPA: hypothetical protein VFW19_11155 [Allosphingosinicella sp.]|nr:hypothetical protein [Allosphingosinicella sp.]